MGWINFSPAGGDVRVTDDALAGYIWNNNFGRINLAPARSGVKNDGEGGLSGKAWGEGVGWIDFDGVSINSQGKFTGMASGTISGRINFDCGRCGVFTDWRPASVRSEGRNTSGQVPVGAGQGTANQGVPPDSETGLYPKPMHPALKEALESELAQAIEKTLAILIPDFIQAKLYSGVPLDIPLRDLLPKRAPLALRSPWRLTSPQAERFALQPLPGETRLLAQKFPELKLTFDRVGIGRMSDVGRLQSAKLALPSFSQMLGLSQTKIVPGRFTLTMGVPAARLPVDVKSRLPKEVVFARSLGERIDLKTNLTFNDKGLPVQQVSTIVGKTLNLVVKPEAPVRSVKGYIVISKDRTNRASAVRLPLNTMVAGSMFAAPRLAQKQAKPIRKESKFVLSEFDYSDPDQDGIYTANIPAPVVPGEYEVITVMDYLSPELGPKEIRLIALVDPEGYVFTKSGRFEARISEAVVSIYWLNQLTGGYELWPAKEYLQENPQTTDKRGTYSFLVPEGEYYLEVKATGFKPYRGEPFDVVEGNGVHTNIELAPEGGWWRNGNLRTMIILGGILAALYYYRVRKYLAQKK